jgi:hypothetical protein
MLVGDVASRRGAVGAYDLAVMRSWRRCSCQAAINAAIRGRRWIDLRT